jgi:hypothetical protein
MHPWKQREIDERNPTKTQRICCLPTPEKRLPKKSSGVVLPRAQIICNEFQ